MSGEIFILYSCDEWKSHSSMRLVCAATSWWETLRVIKEEIMAGNMDYAGLKREEAIDKLLREVDRAGTNLDLVCESLEFGYLDIVEDGERV